MYGISGVWPFSIIVLQIAGVAYAASKQTLSIESLNLLFNFSYTPKNETLSWILPGIVSIVIELIQLKIGRAFDVDDIILNVFGSFLGYFFYRLMDKIFGDLSDTIKGTFIVMGLLIGIVILAIFVI